MIRQAFCDMTNEQGGVQAYGAEGSEDAFPFRIEAMLHRGLTRHSRVSHRFCR